MGKWNPAVVQVSGEPHFPNSSGFKEGNQLEGVIVVNNYIHHDQRGTFRKVLPAEALDSLFGQSLFQVNLSSNPKSGTIRGLHYQIDSFLESKLITCVRGSVFDVLLDLRKDSATYGKCASYYLNPKTGSLLVPPLIAHGFQSLEDDTHLLYLHTNHYSSTLSRGINPFDSDLGIEWPLPTSFVSESDMQLPNLSEVSDL